jgi:uncharacterized protein YodC (DUF2158 family)
MPPTLPILPTRTPPPFAPGDVVTLKSGGPKMTVIAVGKPSRRSRQMVVTCVWIGSHPEAAYEMGFPPIALVKAS